MNNLKTKVDNLDVDKWKIMPVDLSKLSDVVDKNVDKNTKFNTLYTQVNNLEKKIQDATYFIHINQYNTGKRKLEKRIRNADNKTPEPYGLVTATVLNT